MIGVLSFIACLTAWFMTCTMVYAFEGNKKRHNKKTWTLFLVSMAIFAIVSYL